MKEHHPKRPKSPRPPGQAAMLASSRAEIRASVEQLPVTKVQNELKSILSKHRVVVIVGETGSGKTTQIPQFMHQLGYCVDGKKIAITQPRRVAAITIARRVAAEMSVPIGQQVGYVVRFEDCTDEKKTRIQYMTDGMLVRETMLDPRLSKYSVIMIDEAHERTIHTDLLLGVIKGLLTQRNDLRVVIMSATLEAGAFADFFGSCPVIYIEGRQFPVEMYHTSIPQTDYFDACFHTILQLHLEKPRSDTEPSDILCFLTGQEEIESMSELLLEKMKSFPPSVPGWHICPLFAALPYRDQLLAFERAPHGMRKVILATNIAETSVTLNGVRFVIDCGLVKQKEFHAQKTMDILQVIPISKQMARQRTGRAGRECPGECYRLYTKDSFEKDLPEVTVPEIQRSNLSNVLLQMFAMGISNISNFDWINRPSTDALIHSVNHLLALQALDPSTMQLSPTGMCMSRFPLDPSYSRCLLYAHSYDCVEDMLSLLALLSVDSVFFSPTMAEKRERAEHAKKNFLSVYGDHITMLNVFQAYLKAKGDEHWCHRNFVNAKNMKSVEQIREQLKYMHQQFLADPASAKAFPSVPVSAAFDPPMTRVRKCLLAGQFLKSARLIPATRQYQTIQDKQTISIHPSSALFAIHSRGGRPQGETNSKFKSRFPECIVFDEIVLTTNVYARTVSTIELDWLPEVAPHFFGKMQQVQV